MKSPAAIVAFWENEVGEKRWFKSSVVVDTIIRERFGKVYAKARAGKHSDWLGSPEGALALVLLLDQFPRNMFRGQAQAFESDEDARGVARQALARGYDLMFRTALRAFLYMPLMHSEDLADQDRCVALIAQRLGKASMNYPYALAHREEIARFGRFPGRNAALGRISTAAETEYLNQQKRH